MCPSERRLSRNIPVGVALLFDKQPQQNEQPEFKKLFSRTKVVYPGSPPATSQGFDHEYKDADGHLIQSFP